MVGCAKHGSLDAGSTGGGQAELRHSAAAVDPSRDPWGCFLDCAHPWVHDATARHAHEFTWPLFSPSINWEVSTPRSPSNTMLMRAQFHLHAVQGGLNTQEGVMAPSAQQ